jgi:hypothetical protein
MLRERVRGGNRFERAKQKEKNEHRDRRSPQSTQKRGRGGSGNRFEKAKAEGKE